jgi:hypothetical protein
LRGASYQPTRAQEALQAIEAAKHRCGSGSWEWLDFEWEDARIDVLEGLGRTDDAQAARWECFERALSSAHLAANGQPDLRSL